MARKRNPRRVMLELLKPVRDDLYLLHSRWVRKGRKTVWGDGPTRPRREDEYPENDADEWEHAFDVVTMAIKRLERVREQIAREYRAVESRQAGN